eukprot:TRINITY_DN8772_c0_g1_i1.p1 TRINITY_DN8772_c0_g1~~TRINITY_DN8772_c0_g1_i1.p1  ORF type:complete len:138 (+),score=41.42 TRINITY_DN8772_c0_g1_i1:475-888(+)
MNHDIDEGNDIEPVQTSMMPVPLWPSSRHDLFLLEPSTTTTTTQQTSSSSPKVEDGEKDHNDSIRKEGVQQQQGTNSNSGRTSPSSSSAAEHLSLIHISEPTRLLSISYAVFCLKKKNIHPVQPTTAFSHTPSTITS